MRNSQISVDEAHRRHAAPEVDNFKPTSSLALANRKTIKQVIGSPNKYTFIDVGDSVKGSVKLIQRVKVAHSFLVCVKSVPLYHFKLACVVLHIAVKEFFEIFRGNFERRVTRCTTPGNLPCRVNFSPSEQNAKVAPGQE